MRSKVMHLVMSVCVRTYYTYICTYTTYVHIQCKYINKNRLLRVLSLAKIIILMNVIYYLLFEMPLVWFAMSSKPYRQSNSCFSK